MTPEKLVEKYGLEAYLQYRDAQSSLYRPEVKRRLLDAGLEAYEKLRTSKRHDAIAKCAALSEDVLSLSMPPMPEELLPLFREDVRATVKRYLREVPDAGAAE